MKLKDSIPFISWIKFKLLNKYSDVGIGMLKEILVSARIEWEKADWRQEIELVMFKNNPNGIFSKDTSWKALKKTGMTRKRWKLLSADHVPDKRPDKWTNKSRSHALTWLILPENYLYRVLGNGITKKDSILKFVHDVRYKSVEQLELEFSANGTPDFNSEELACFFCMGWWSAKAWERHTSNVKLNKSNIQNFFDWGYGESFFENFINLLNTTSVFDSRLNERFVMAVNDLYKWYVMPHCITGMFSVLDNNMKSYSEYLEDNATFIKRLCFQLKKTIKNFLENASIGYSMKYAPYGADKMYDEVCSKAADIVKTKNQLR